MTTRAGVEGFAPVVGQGQGNPEAMKYGKLWADHPEYRAVAPGEEFAKTFLDHAKPKPGTTLIDFGCGTGRGAFHLATVGGMKVTMIDFVKNCLDSEVAKACEVHSDSLKFVKKDLEKPIGLISEYGYCTDVMEHIPTDKVDQVINNILGSAQHVFFAICTAPDHCGKLIGEQLHLTVQPYDWWMEHFKKRECVIHWSAEIQDYALFYVSGWSTGNDLVKAGGVNESRENIRANVQQNCKDGWAHVQPHVENDMEVMIVGGGPSLQGQLETIQQMRANGVKLITLNGTYNWALQHGLIPSCQLMVDSRPFNARFTKPCMDDEGKIHGSTEGLSQEVVDGLLHVRYLIASQCHPSVFAGLPKSRTLMWHTMYDSIEDVINAEYQGPVYPIPSATTVLVTSFFLLRQLGFKKFHLFGCDSCLASDKSTHHAYEQPENDTDIVAPVMLNDGRVFHCHPWMAAQAQQFIDMLQVMRDEVEIEIYGDGLLRHVLEVGASLADQQGEK
jgi:precorrin-6B methylase 2